MWGARVALLGPSGVTESATLTSTRSRTRWPVRPLSHHHIMLDLPRTLATHHKLRMSTVLDRSIHPSTRSARGYPPSPPDLWPTLTRLQPIRVSNKPTTQSSSSCNLLTRSTLQLSLRQQGSLPPRVGRAPAGLKPRSQGRRPKVQEEGNSRD
jgi:hypothetical protein